MSSDGDTIDGGEIVSARAGGQAAGDHLHREPAESSGASVLSMIQHMVQSDAPMDKLDKLLDLQERVEKREAKKAYDAALAAAQAEFPVIRERGEIRNRDGKVQSRYPLMEDVQRALVPILGKHGLRMSFDIQQPQGVVEVTCIVAHKMGHEERTPLTLPHDDSGSKNRVQAIGSSISYGQRYTSKARLNWVSETESADDGGQAAGAAPTITAKQYRQLVKLIAEAAASEERLLRHVGVESLDLIPQDRWDEVFGMLNTKKRQRAAAQKGEAQGNGDAKPEG